MVLTDKQNYAAGITKKVKTGDSPLEINDQRKIDLSGDSVGASALRFKRKITTTAGISNPSLLKSPATANRI